MAIWTDEREWTATERGFRLGVLMAMGGAYTTAEVTDILGYGSYSAAASMLERMRADGLYRDDRGRWRILIDARDWPF